VEAGVGLVVVARVVGEVVVVSSGVEDVEDWLGELGLAVTDVEVELIDVDKMIDELGVVEVEEELAEVAGIEVLLLTERELEPPTEFKLLYMLNLLEPPH
jgi:hypothetical protein